MRLFTRLSVGSLLLLTGHSVQAQKAAQSPKPVTLKLGALLPLNGAAKFLGSQWLAAGAEYNLHTSGTTLPVAYLDYAGADKHGQRDTILGLGIAVRSYGVSAKDTDNGTSVYYGGGLGAYSLHQSGRYGNHTTTSIGVKANIGLEFPNSVFGEVAYTYLPTRLGGADLSGFVLSLGIRL